MTTERVSLKTVVCLLLSGASTCAAPVAFAQPTGAPPPDAAALVKNADAPKGAAAIDKVPNGSTVTLSAGGQYVTGNARLLAATANAAYLGRWGNDGFGASLLANYGEGAAPGNDIVETAANLQGRVRYDRYLLDNLSLFLIATGRNDTFQGLDFRLNIDPGVKYLFVNRPTTSLWGEAGYDFQYDVRTDTAREAIDPTTNAIIQPTSFDLPKTATDHSGRFYVGFREAFNEQVTLSTGLEYLQSLQSDDSFDYRLNYDALFAAKVGAGLAVGFGMTVRYDHDPLPGKRDTDLTSTVSLIYGFSDVAKPPPPPPPACVPPPPPPPPPPPQAATAPAPAAPPQEPDTAAPAPTTAPSAPVR